MHVLLDNKGDNISTIKRTIIIACITIREAFRMVEQVGIIQKP